MRRILSFVTIFLSGLHSFPVEPDDQLNLFSLDADPMAESANANLDLTYQPSEADDIFSSVGSDEFLFNDLINPILLSDEASSTVSQWMGEPMDSINVARSLDSLQPFDIAAKQEGFCLKDGEQKSPPIKLNLPTSLDDLDILVNPKPLGVWICPGSAQILLCCKPSQSQYVTRARCKRCKFFFLKKKSHQF